MNSVEDYLKDIKDHEDKVKQAQADLKAAKEAAKVEIEKGKAKANKEIAKLVNEAEAKISEAEKIANKFGLTFDFSLAYGMGGTYYPAKDETTEDEDDWRSSNEGWVSSSANC